LLSFGCAIAIFLLTPGLLLAQTNVTGYIYGQVRTESGDPVPAASVTIVNAQTGLTRSLAARSNGSYRFPALPIGTYSILVEATDFLSVAHDALMVSIGIGTPANAVLVGRQEDTLALNTLNVVGGRVSAIDVKSVESSTLFTAEELDRLPVVRDPAAIALLAPGTTENARFGVTFGGASAAENAIYINGMDVTNFRNGLGGSTVPYEFYDEFQVKTGGYGAEFGRSTGGVVNRVTRRGGNDWHFGAAVYHEPEDLRETSPNVLTPEGSNPFSPDYWQYNAKDTTGKTDLHAYLSGPIIKDRLFFYAIVNQVKQKGYDDFGPFSFLGWEEFAASKWDWSDTFWGVKLDWQVNDNHALEFTAFSDAVDQKIEQFDRFTTGEFESIGSGHDLKGGETYILRYTGYFGQNLTLSSMIGHSRYDDTFLSDNDDVPVVVDDRDFKPNGRFPTPWINFRVGIAADERDMFRFDGEWSIGSAHLLRFGVDALQNTSDDLLTHSGDVYWRYWDVTPGDTFQGVPIPEGVTQVVRERIDRSGGGFEVSNTAFYIEDHWQVTDNTMIYLGLRNETFENKNAISETFVKMGNQLAPRLGFSWDFSKDGTAKLFGTAGRYYLPMPTVVNINLSGARFFTEEWFVLEGLNPDSTPIKGDSYAFFVINDGEIPDSGELLDRSLESTYQDEFILGLEYEPFAGWQVGVRGIYRDLKQAIEDVDMSRALNAYAAANGYDDFHAPLFGAYVLTNPGSDAYLSFDLDFDGISEDIVLPAASIGIPRVNRTYKALELFFKRSWNNDWFLQGSYTYSQSRGNYEGWTRTDIGQTSAALTASFDLPELMEGADGRLPNDRPHTLKLFGAWRFAGHWELSGNFLYQSGAPISALGAHPDLPTFLNVAFYLDGEVLPRGTLDRNKALTQLDLGLQFRLPLKFKNGNLQLRLDVINVLDGDTVTHVNEFSQQQSGLPEPSFLFPNNFQQPRYVRLGARVDF